MSHTPGPWKVVKPAHGQNTKLRCVQLGKDKSYTTLEVQPDDAKLIAAAIDLLQACKVAVEYGTCPAVSEKLYAAIAKAVEYGTCPAVSEKLYAAIAKAEGTR